VLLNKPRRRRRRRRIPDKETYKYFF